MVLRLWGRRWGTVLPQLPALLNFSTVVIMLSWRLQQLKEKICVSSLAPSLLALRPQPDGWDLVASRHPKSLECVLYGACACPAPMLDSLELRLALQVACYLFSRCFQGRVRRLAGEPAAHLAPLPAHLAHLERPWACCWGGVSQPLSHWGRGSHPACGA